ncbi:MAG TPA: ATP-dependent DNA helicase [Saprospiraceae bacterium]|nr:ATP-dependent DNA helicase [Saprospiraceae bacterium]
MTFEEKLASLNSEQRSAVDTTEGPVMVIAGPGTGKTEILSLRIGHIIKEGRAEAKDILCLTYTDAAASEMRHRLIEYIGPEAYSIQVNTFHSFCNLVIQENLSLFQQARELEPISDIDKFRLLQRLIDSFHDDHPLKKFKGQTYSSWDRLLDLFSTMKKEDWSPSFIYQQIDHYVERQRNSEKFIYKKRTGDFQKGDFKEKDFRTFVLDKMEVLKAAVGEFDHYNALLAEEGKYDYDDMLSWVFNAFSNNPDLLADYQERFLYFLVDEFQDTNGIQINILQKLIDHEWIDKPNVFVVGDDDQAIYRFQGASIRNLINFKSRYDPQIILLEKNYRSSQLILNASRRVMLSVADSLMIKIFGEPKKLKAAGVSADFRQRTCIHAYPSGSYENADIFYKLRKWQELNEEGSVAVLYTKHELGSDLAYALKGAGVPFQTARSSDALQLPLIQNLLDILSCIRMLAEGADNDDGLLYRILHLKYLEPRNTDLQRLILAYTAKERDDRSTLFMWLGDKVKLDALNLQDRNRMNEMFALLDEGVANYHTVALITLIEWIVHRFGIMRWVLQQPEKFIHLYAIKAFYSFVDSEGSGKSSFTGADLIELCEMMLEYKIRLSVQELASKPTGIYLSTLHGAKGLEFDTVFIKSFVENEWEKKRVYNRQFSLPDNLIRNEDAFAELDEEQDVEDHDRRRLVYVGMTRAKKELFLTYAKKRDDGKLLTPSKYLTEIAKDDTCIQNVEVSSSEEILADYLVARMSGRQQVDLDLDNEEIKRRIENYVLNVSALNQYLECPLKFFYEKILLIPAAEKAHFIFGSALHDALQKFIDRRFRQKDTTAGLQFLLWAFDLYMDKHKHLFTKKDFSDQSTYGRKVLTQYFEHYSTKWSDEIKYETEYRIRDIHVEGVPVTGFIDRLDKVGDALYVYDYKTGRTDKYYEKLAIPSDKSANGGPYWRQMVFYDLLLRKDQRVSGHMEAGFIQALEPDKEGKFIEKKIEVTQEGRQIVTDLIVDTYQKIKNMEFDSFCGECEWCKMHDLVPPYPGEDSEEEL